MTSQPTRGSVRPVLDHPSSAVVQGEAKQMRTTNGNALLASVHLAFAFIEFNIEGTVQEVNDNFLNLYGYTRDEVIGQDRGLFFSEAMRRSPEYTERWATLCAKVGIVEGEQKRIGKNGKEIWMKISYVTVAGLDDKAERYRGVRIRYNPTETSLFGH